MTLCDKHWMQMDTFGKIPERTIADCNEIIIYGDYAEIILYDKYCHESGRTLIDTEDIDKVKHLKWRLNNKGYVTSGAENICLHRIVTDCPDELVVDHISHNTLDNRKANLRVCTQKENARNIKQRKSLSGCTGVIWSSRYRKWQVEIRSDDGRHYLGRYKDLNEAIKIRKEAEQKYFGEFAYKEAN
jgi:hypothetical protein